MTRAEIDDTVAAILIKEGPDGHCDGHEVITGFIIELLHHRGEEWMMENGYADE